MIYITALRVVNKVLPITAARVVIVMVSIARVGLLSQVVANNKGKWDGNFAPKCGKMWKNGVKCGYGLY